MKFCRKHPWRDSHKPDNYTNSYRGPWVANEITASELITVLSVSLSLTSYHRVHSNACATVTKRYSLDVQRQWTKLGTYNRKLRCAWPFLLSIFGILYRLSIQSHISDHLRDTINFQLQRRSCLGNLHFMNIFTFNRYILIKSYLIQRGECIQLRT